MKDRGVKDILPICADGFVGIKEAIAAAYPKTEYKRCIVRRVWNTLKYISEKGRKPFAADLRSIYQAAAGKAAMDALERATAKYPNSMKRWEQNWNAISPILQIFGESPKGDLHDQ